MAGVLYIYPTQFKLHHPGRVASAYGRLTADTSDFILPQLRTKFGQRALSHAGPAAWNNLPQNLRGITEFSISKKHLKSHLFTETYYVT